MFDAELDVLEDFVDAFFDCLYVEGIERGAFVEDLSDCDWAGLAGVVVFFEGNKSALEQDFPCSCTEFVVDDGLDEDGEAFEAGFILKKRKEKFSCPFGG